MSTAFAVSKANTLQENSPWWAVDLGHVAVISKIVIHNRKDGYGELSSLSFSGPIFDAQRVYMTCCEEIHLPGIVSCYYGSYGYYDYYGQISSYA